MEGPKPSVEIVDDRPVSLVDPSSWLLPLTDRKLNKAYYNLAFTAYTAFSLVLSLGLYAILSHNAYEHIGAALALVHLGVLVWAMTSFRRTAIADATVDGSIFNFVLALLFLAVALALVVFFQLVIVKDPSLASQLAMSLCGGLLLLSMITPRSENLARRMLSRSG